MQDFKLEQRQSALGVEQWVVVPQGRTIEHVRPATREEVSLWKAWQSTRALNERLLSDTRDRYRAHAPDRGWCRDR